MLRQVVFGRQAWIVDVKGEYERLAAAMGVTPIALSPGGRVRLNPLTPQAGPERQLNLLYSVAAAALERPLTPEEKRSAQEALRVLERRSADEPTLPAVVDVLIHAPSEMADALALPVEELAAATRPMAFALDQLCSGNLRGMFDGPTTPGLDLSAPLVVLNLRAVLNTHTTALGILMTCATALLQAMIEAERARGHQRADGREDGRVSAARKPPRFPLSGDEPGSLENLGSGCSARRYAPGRHCGSRARSPRGSFMARGPGSGFRRWEACWPASANTPPTRRRRGPLPSGASFLVPPLSMPRSPSWRPRSSPEPPYSCADVRAAGPEFRS